MSFDNQTLTSANSVITLQVAGLYDTPFQLSNYTTDAAWDTDEASLTESLMGVDGIKKSGWTPTMRSQKFHLMATSPSKEYIHGLKGAMQAIREVYYIEGVIYLPATGEKFYMHDGTLKSYKPLPDGGKILGTLDFSIEWGNIDRSITS